MIEALVGEFFKEGALVVRLPGGKQIAVGRPRDGETRVVVRLTDMEAAARIARQPSPAAGEAFMDGKLIVEEGDLYDFAALCVRNVKYRRRPVGLFGGWRRRLKQANARAAARANVAHHYDLSSKFFGLFLDDDRQYSCAYFTDPHMSLDEAQVAKKRHIAAKLLLSPGHRVLDIGSGWGGLALALARNYGAHVLGVTLSKKQLAVARERAIAMGADTAVRFELQDYRDVEGEFDRIVSVGMLEHVGATNYQGFFNALARLLNEDGVALIHTIGRRDGPGSTDPWIAKYIFPGGNIPALSELAIAIERSGLALTDLEVLGVHYADTLRAWRQRFNARRAEAAAMYDERFCRMWDFYLACSEASFRVGVSVVFQFQLAKRRDAAPRTRDYITDFDRAGDAVPHAGAGEAARRPPVRVAGSAA